MEQLIQVLRKFDFSENEAKIYITLMRYGAQNGYEVSKNSGVPRSRVYNLLEKLVTRGVIVTNPQEKTIIYRAEPIERVIAIIQSNVNEGIQELTRESEKFAKPDVDEKMWQLNGYDSILSKAKEMITSAKEEILVQVWQEDLSSELEAFLAEKEKHLKIIVVLYDQKKQYNTKLQQVYHHGFEGDSLNEIGARWLTVVVDNQEMLYATIPHKSLAKASYTTNSGMVFFAREYVTHDAYCLRLIQYMPKEVQSRFGKDMEGVRDIFAIHNS